MSQALDVGCPTCGAPAGEKCRYLLRGRSRKVRLLTSDLKLIAPHKARWQVRHALDEPVIPVDLQLLARNQLQVANPRMNTRERARQQKKKWP